MTPGNRCWLAAVKKRNRRGKTRTHKALDLFFVMGRVKFSTEPTMYPLMRGSWKSMLVTQLLRRETAEVRRIRGSVLRDRAQGMGGYFQTI
jgi:hypothetical protein